MSSKAVRKEGVNGKALTPDNLLACRSCLSTDCKLYDLHNNSLAEDYADLTGMAAKVGDGLPQYLCAFCCALLRKAVNFRSKCRTAHFYLLGILAERETLTTKYLRSMKKPLLRTTFLKTNILTVDTLPEDAETQLVTVEIMPENNNDNTMYNADDPFVPANIKPDPDQVDDDKKTKQEYVDIAQVTEFEDVFAEDNEDQVKVEHEPDSKCSDSDSDDSLNMPLSKIKHEYNMKSEVVDRGKPGGYYSKYHEEMFGKHVTEKKYNVQVTYLEKDEQIREFEARKDTASYMNAAYKCEICYKGFLREKAYKNHLEVHDPSTGKFACDICKTYSRLHRGHAKHVKRHMERFRCMEKGCDVITYSTAQARIHYNWHKGAKFQCQQCQTVYDKLSTYMTHLRKHHGSTSCSICSEQFLGERGLRSHMLKAHRKMTQYRCSECGVQFLSSSSLQRHASEAPSSGCQNVRPCEHCGLNLSDEQALLEHLQAEHKMTLRCERCNITFRNELLYRKHSYHVHNERRRRGRGAGGNHVTADERDRVRRSSRRDGDDSERAERRHQGIKCMCEMCGRYFRCNAVMKAHQRIHTGERPYKCTVCGKGFTTNMYLKVHMNTHTGVKPYQCPHCFKAFTIASQRDRHLLVHTKEKPFACHICGKAYQQKIGMTMHIRTIHMMEPWPKRVRRSAHRLASQ